MKKLLILCLALGMLLTLAGCYRANMLDKEALPPDEVLPPTCGEEAVEEPEATDAFTGATPAVSVDS
jgi:predicted small lipoprotein YifL